MTIKHIAAIHFDGHLEAARKRVYRLMQGSFLTKRSRGLTEPATYTITSNSLTVLRAEGKLDRYGALRWERMQKRLQASSLTLEHELAVMDCKAAVHRAVVTSSTCSLLEFCTWPKLIQFTVPDSFSGLMTLIKPDGFIWLRMPEKNVHFFLEVDRSTETLDILVKKIGYYRSFYLQGGFAKRLGYLPAEYRRAPFRVLVVCKSKARQSNIRTRLLALEPPIKSFVCLATLDDFIARPLAVLELKM